MHSQVLVTFRIGMYLVVFHSLLGYDNFALLFRVFYILKVETCHEFVNVKILHNGQEIGIAIPPTYLRKETPKNNNRRETEHFERYDKRLIIEMYLQKLRTSERARCTIAHGTEESKIHTRGFGN